jgi:hypothetical protein
MRLRQLAISQSVTFIAPPEVHQSIQDHCHKLPRDPIDSSDVISWLLEQTCMKLEQFQSLYLAQGMEFCYRQQAASDFPKFVSDDKHRQKYLAILLQIEQQTLKQLYCLTASSKQDSGCNKYTGKIKDFVKHLNASRHGLARSSISVHASALQEVEQEREVAHEVETVREVQRPLRFKAYEFPGLHDDIKSFAEKGFLPAESSAFELAICALERSMLAKKLRNWNSAAFPKLYVSAQFTKTVDMEWSKDWAQCDQFQVCGTITS